MDELATKYYLNPLTLEAQMFVNSMETYGKTWNHLDENLHQTLKNVLVAIEKFLGQNLSPIVETENTKLVHPREVDNVIRFYHCCVCKKSFGNSAENVTTHLANSHKIEKKKSKEKNVTTHLANGHKSEKKKSKEKNGVRQRQRQNQKENRANLKKKLPKEMDMNPIIEMDMSKFFSDNILVAEKLKNIPEYDIIEGELLELVKPLFPLEYIKVYKFGSRMTGIGSRNSDLDLFIDIAKTFNNFENKASALTMKNLISVYGMLKKNVKSWPHLRAIKSARVPILRVLNAKTGIECDIGFSNSLSFCNTKLLEYFFGLQPIVRRMCIFLKKWLEISKLNDHISTYSISLMVIYFLQIHKKLPPIEILQFGLDKTVNVGPWISNFIEKKMSDLNIQRLDITPANCTKELFQYFQFYSKFNFEKFVVCPYFGRFIEITQIEVEMPQRYTTYVQSNEEDKDSALQLKKSMVIQDPIQLNHNVSKGVTPNILKNIQYYFQQSSEVLEAKLHK